MKKASYCYKIKNKEGLYSNGRQFLDFTNKGKVWTTMAGLKNHLNSKKDDEYKDCEIFEIEIIEKRKCTVQELLQEIKEDKREKENKERESGLKAQERTERELLKALKEKYE